MPYNQQLNQRIRWLLEDHPGLVEKKMFGGVGYMLHGNLACGVLGDDLIARVGPEKNAAALAKPHVRPFLSPADKPMAGWVLVAKEGLETDQELLDWVEQGCQFASSLPEKK